jgi:4-hydroxy-3-polyprenylbenzoate decarboxylase
MPFKDMREFINKLEVEGEAQRIDEEVDWDLEAGAMVRRSNERDLPAPFFQKVKDYPDGYRIFGAPLSNQKRVAIAMDMDANTPARELIAEYLKRKQQPVKPVLVSGGPCKENISLGDELDLLKFPVPMVHLGDAGRYIGTFHLVVAKDLDSQWVNWSMQRLMVHNKNTIGIQAPPQSHLGMIYGQGYEPRNKPMEVAIAIGTEPISNLCAASSIPHGVSEVDIAGGIRGEPVELVECETVDLAVPATAEIVIEGEIRPQERMDEGPFGEYTGYMTPHPLPRPVIHVKAVTHRNNPILTMTCEGVPSTESHAILFVTKAAQLMEELRARGLPVTGVCAFVETCCMLVAVAVKVPYANVAGEIAHVIWASRQGRGTPYIIVVEDDVDPFNMDQVLHALITKCHPYRGIVRLEHAVGLPLAPWADRYERRHMMGARAYFDCTWPVTWDSSEVPKKSSFETIYPVAVQQKALAKWQKYGY